MGDLGCHLHLRFFLFLDKIPPRQAIETSRELSGSSSSLDYRGWEWSMVSDILAKKKVWLSDKDKSPTLERFQTLHCRWINQSLALVVSMRRIHMAPRAWQYHDVDDKYHVRSTLLYASAREHSTTWRFLWMYGNATRTFKLTVFYKSSGQVLYDCTYISNFQDK